MMEPLIVSLALVVAALAAAVVAQLRLSIRREAARFKIFAARDRLYLAVADGVIDPGSPEFREHLEALNNMLRSSEAVGISLFLRILAFPKAGSDPVQGQGLPKSARMALMEVALSAGDGLTELMSINSRIVRVVKMLARTTNALRERSEQAMRYSEISEKQRSLREFVAV